MRHSATKYLTVGSLFVASSTFAADQSIYGIVGNRDANGRPIETRGMLAQKAQELSLSPEEVSRLRKTVGEITCARRDHSDVIYKSGTGFLIGQGGLVMTNSHVLVEDSIDTPNGGAPLASEVWGCFWQNRETPPHQIPLDIRPQGLKLFSAGFGDLRDIRDLAVVRLKGRVPDAIPFGLNNGRFNLKQGDQLIVMSPSALRMPSLPKPTSYRGRTDQIPDFEFQSQKELIAQKCTSRELVGAVWEWAGFIHSDCVSTPGMSGSPTMVRSEAGELVIVAVHEASYGIYPDYTPYSRDHFSVQVRLGTAVCREIQAFQDTFEKPASMSPVANGVSMLGVSISNLTEDVRKKYNIENSVEGVAIVETNAEVSKISKLLAPGNVVLKVAQDPVVDASSFATLINEYRLKGRRNALLQIRISDGGTGFAAVPFDLVEFVARRDRDCLLPYRRAQ